MPVLCVGHQLVALTEGEAPPTIRAIIEVRLIREKSAGVEGVLGNGVRDQLDPEGQ
jgi:hypothetical protein